PSATLVPSSPLVVESSRSPSNLRCTVKAFVTVVAKSFAPGCRSVNSAASAAHEDGFNLIFIDVLGMNLLVVFGGGATGFSSFTFEFSSESGRGATTVPASFICECDIQSSASEIEARRMTCAQGSADRKQASGLYTSSGRK